MHELSRAELERELEKQRSLVQALRQQNAALLEVLDMVNMELSEFERKLRSYFITL